MVSLNASTIKFGILSFMWGEYLWNLYLFIREYRTIASTNEVPQELTTIMTRATFDRSQAYALTKMRFGLFGSTLSIILTSYGLYYGHWAESWEYAKSVAFFGDGEVSTTCTWILISNVYSLLIIDIPSKLYLTFYVEGRFGFNNQTIGFFICDQIKSFVFEQVMLVLITPIMIVVIKHGGHYLFLWLWFLGWSISMFLVMLYFSVIAPLFDIYTPLPPGPLRTEIEELAKQLNFPLTQIFLIKGSERTSHSNAFIMGMLNVQTIVLFDTLFPETNDHGCSDQEIVAILCHEFGHWKHNHTIIDYILMEINMFCGLALFSRLFTNEEIYKAVGFYDSQPVIIGLVTILQFILIPFNSVWRAITMWNSRRFELQADVFAIEMGKAQPLRTALIHLHRDNLDFPVHDPLFSNFHLSHPSLLERLDAIKKVLAERN